MFVHVPGISCLATIMLSLRDTSIRPRTDTCCPYGTYPLVQHRYASSPFRPIAHSSSLQSLVGAIGEDIQDISGSKGALHTSPGRGFKQVAMVG
jgi:hypothetical protein